jgi:hypothetical protein
MFSARRVWLIGMVRVLRATLIILVFSLIILRTLLLAREATVHGIEGKMGRWGGPWVDGLCIGSVGLLHICCKSHWMFCFLLFRWLGTSWPT